LLASAVATGRRIVFISSCTLPHKALDLRLVDLTQSSASGNANVRATPKAA